MQLIELDGRLMSKKETLYPYIKNKLALPDYTGTNLDALWDAISTLSRNVNIRLVYTDDFLYELSPYGKAVLSLFLDLAEDEKNIKVEIQKNFNSFDEESI